MAYDKLDIDKSLYMKGSCKLARVILKRCDNLVVKALCRIY